MPLIEVLQDILRYAKFVKDIVANKIKLAKFETVILTEEYSSRILNNVKLPATQKVLGSFTVQVTISKCNNVRGLCDLGASINLMLRSILKKLRLGEPKPTTILLQLANRFVARPDDFNPDPEVPFILGRPFLATGSALIDVAVSRLTMSAYEKVEVFDVYQALKLPVVYEELFVITVIDKEVVA
ncbi:uncharacterized protein LOC129903704 [Solanum dulcamara]|uniref:uncharacterized protein LOC129903704 n=1 Tax=Solanum dulcamara TaxID=45834 RepID=UPI002485F120|nr:uncharacterized protein LOC129903704 [Solanum dulcamara]